ncbi:MAG: DUF2303 family protein [Spartobacteria bacterium]|nr:DUF2303 family protein [Spartobacteria bacterium]
MNDNSDNNILGNGNVGEILRAGRALGGQYEIKTPYNGVPQYAIVPSGYELKDLSVLKDETPDRIAAFVQMMDMDSFCEYINNYKEKHSLIFMYVDFAGGLFEVKGYLDYHAPDSPSFVTHICALMFRYSTEFLEWSQKNKKSISQSDFAYFLEENALDIISPPGAEVLEAVRNLMLTQSAAFRSSINLDNGDVRLEYSQETKNAGSIEMPTKMTVQIPIFDNFEPVEIEMRLRYRLANAVLQIEYNMLHVEKMLKDFFVRLATEIMDATDLPVYQGKY